MAKEKKSPAKKAAAKGKPATTKKAVMHMLPPGIPLVANQLETPISATVNVTFISGVGQVTLSLFRNGVLINMQSISSSADIPLSDVQTGDGIAIVGVAAGQTKITISVTTSPATPEELPAGPIFRSYIIQ